MALLFTSAVVSGLSASPARASYYRMVLCAANNGSNGFQTATNTASAQNPGGIFNFENYCGPAPFPAGNNAFLRIDENQSGGLAGYTAYGQMSWTAPGFVMIAAGGGYTREPDSFNEGWRGRFWLEGYDGSTNNELMQGSGVVNGSCGGVCWATTPVFGSHLWPFGSFGSYRRFVFELTCYRQAGCDRTNFNAVDANTMILTLNDVDPSHINLTNTGSGHLAGEWVKGTQHVTWNVSDLGSGMRFDRVRVDGGQRELIDWRGVCNIDSNGGVGEFARDFQPCPVGGPWGRDYALDTSAYSDGEHTIQVCSQDYGQAMGLNGSGGESCDQRSIRVDNHPPAAPGDLSIETSNPARYLDHFGARWKLPPDPGSPIAKVHYRIVNAAGSVVVPEQMVAGTNPTKLDNVAGPKAAGDYRLQVWLEDGVGFTGPMATVPIPHDTTPPAAPQDVSVTAPTTPRRQQGFDITWRNITDNGAPVDAAHYQVLNGAGEVVVPTKDLAGDNPQALADLDAPQGSGNYTLRVWVSDAEGNVGAPAEAPLSYNCVKSDAGSGTQLSASVDGAPSRVVAQGEGATVEGVLRGAIGPVASASVCVFSNVVTDESRDFLGLAITGKNGGYRFGIAPGPSRNLVVLYRSNHREIREQSKMETVVRPTLYAKKKTVRNKQFGRFYGGIPGPHNDRVVVVLQARRGKGWIAFRRYRTRGGGRFSLVYRFHNTTRPTQYVMRAQVRQTTGYPYLQGNSARLMMRVLPSR